jgi:hypothetical protein
LLGSEGLGDVFEEVQFFGSEGEVSFVKLLRDSAVVEV